MSSLHSDTATPGARHARPGEASGRVRWNIERDVIRGRRFDLDRKFLPDGLSRVGELPFLSSGEARLLSQVQGRTYANMFALVERFVGAGAPAPNEADRLGDPAALAALADAQMPPGYRFVPEACAAAGALPATRSDWAMMALTLGIELFALAHYRSSIGAAHELCPLWRDVFRFHWQQQSQHAIVDEMAWRLEHARLTEAERDRGVDDLIALVGAADEAARAQAAADAGYFLASAGHAFGSDEAAAVKDRLFAAYRWQYIVSGAQEPRFGEVLQALTTRAQRQRIALALAPIAEHAAS